MSNAIYRRADLVQEPQGTPTRFSVAQFFWEHGSKLNAPCAHRLMSDLNAALVKPFLDVSGTQGEAVVHPDCMLDDGHRESVAVGPEVGHERSAYPARLRQHTINTACFPPSTVFPCWANTRSKGSMVQGLSMMKCRSGSACPGAIRSANGVMLSRWAGRSHWSMCCGRTQSDGLDTLIAALIQPLRALSAV